MYTKGGMKFLRLFLDTSSPSVPFSHNNPCAIHAKIHTYIHSNLSQDPKNTALIKASAQISGSCDTNHKIHFLHCGSLVVASWVVYLHLKTCELGDTNSQLHIHPTEDK